MSRPLDMRRGPATTPAPVTAAATKQKVRAERTDVVHASIALEAAA